MPCFVIIGVLGTMALGADSVRADQQEEVAAESFRRGADAYAHRDYRGAALAFEAAHRIVPRAATIYNAALAWASAGEDVRAADDFAAALAAGLDAARAADAEKRLKDLEKKVGRLEVTAPSGSKIAIDGDEVLAPAGRMHATAGARELRIVFPDGATDTRRITVVRGEVERVDFTPPAPASAPAPAPKSPVPPAAPPPSASATPPETAPPPPPASGSSKRTFGWIALGGGAALSGVAIFLGVSGLQARNDFVDGGGTDASLHDRAVSLRTWTNVAWAGAAVLGATGLVLLLTSGGGGNGAGSSALVLGPAGLWEEGRF